jgi:simple sugar transport system permease protein
MVGPRAHGHPWHDFLIAHAPVLSIAAFFVLVCVFFAVATDAFLTQPNLLNLTRQSAPMLIVAVAMTLVITTGGIDLSVGSAVALVNALAAIALQADMPWPAVVVLMLVLGGAVGAMQGWFIAFEGIPAFIVTLAGLSVLRGMALLLTQGYSVPIPPESWFVVLGRGWFLGVPLPRSWRWSWSPPASSRSRRRAMGGTSPRSARTPRPPGAPASTSVASRCRSMC